MTIRWWLAIALASASFGCSSRASTRLPDVRPIVMPDLSSVDESVREQAHLRETALRRTMASMTSTAADRANAYGELGKLLLAAEYGDPAETCFGNAELLAPFDARWPYYRGHAYRKTTQLPQAGAAFERALTREPANLAAMYWLGQTRFDQGRTDEAASVFSRALRIAPTSAPILAALGRVDLARNDYATAVTHLEQALAVDPSAMYVHYPLAMAYRGVGDLTKAEAELRRPRAASAAPADPLMQDVTRLLDSAMAYQSRGIDALRRNDAASAAVLFRRATELNPASGPLHHRLGTALFLLGDVDGATREFGEALKLSPQLARAHYSLGVILASRKENAAAIEHFTAALRTDADYLEARMALADVLRGLGRAKDAMPHYAEVLQRNPGAVDAELGYAMSLVILGRRDEARARFLAGAKQHPDRSEFADALRHLSNGSDTP
jgi:tetratricopeptide (TPR) repeat protein